jgi:hypothetical protein
MAIVPIVADSAIEARQDASEVLDRVQRDRVDDELHVGDSDGLEGA